MTVSESTRLIIANAARENGVTFDTQTDLYKVSPDVYYFNSVRITDECAKSGVCKYERFVAVVTGYQVTIENA